MRSKPQQLPLVIRRDNRKDGAMIDWNIRFGDILVMASLAGAMFIYAFRAGGLKQSFDSMKEDLTEMKEAQNRMTTLLMQVAVQESRLDSMNDRINILDGRIESMQRGKGFIVSYPRPGG